MNSAIRIRLMSLDDLPEVMEIERENFSVPWSEQSFCDMMTSDHALFLVAESEGANLGYAGAVYAGDQADVTNIAVSDRNKRQGIGRMLLKELIAAIRERGVHEVFLEVRESNEPAIALYRSVGFVPVGTRKKYYVDPCEDAILMRLDETVAF